MTEKHLHASHPDVVKRLKRANGHLANVIAMIESHRPCNEIAQQLHAVERAISAAKKVVIHDHLDLVVFHGLPRLVQLAAAYQRVPALIGASHHNRVGGGLVAMEVATAPLGG